MWKMVLYSMYIFFFKISRVSRASAAMFLWCEANWAYWEVKQQMDVYKHKIIDLEARIVKAKEGGGVVRFYNICYSPVAYNKSFLGSKSYRAARSTQL